MLKQNDQIINVNRFQGIDLLKCLAILTIPAQHFFTLQTPFYHVNFDTVSMFFQGVGMGFFLIGVPLFIAITGYLNKKTEPSWSYYKKIFKVLIPYLLISIIYLFFRHYYCNETISFRNSLDMILCFNAIRYAWYIEMWIGLYLLAPFLNILYDNITSKKTSIILVVTLYVMTYLTLSVNRGGLHILPNYWVDISPLTCYFIGCHIRKFGVKIKTKNLILFILFAITADPIINLLFFHGQPYRFIFGIYFLIVPAMAALFAILHDWQTSKQWLQKILAIVSDHTLEMYLYCALCDMILYPFFMKWYVSQSQFGLFFFVIIPIELIATFCMAFITNKIIKLTHIDNLWKK